jgi:uncharacterized protein (TIGR02001 family)
MTSRTLLSGALGASLICLALPASARDVSLSWGATFTTNYMSSGETQTDDGPAFQPWVEVEVNGFYAGLWGSNVRFPRDPDLRRDRFEVEAYLGYRFDIGSVAVDLGYQREAYDWSGLHTTIVYALVEYETERATFHAGIELETREGFAVDDRYAGVRVPLGDRFTASALLGRSGTTNYGDLGVSYDITDNVELDLRFHGGPDNRLVLSTAFSF